MSQTIRFIRHIGVRCAVLLLVFAWAAVSSGLAESTTTYPPVKLRGYGTVSGERTLLADGHASLLKIVCENENKAKLVLAKYLSDLQLLPGVTSVQPADGSGATIYQVDSQGSVMAARNDATVSIYSGDLSPVDLRKLDAAAFLAKPGRFFKPEMAVPMYLDRWDKYGFRFYYGPFAVPKDAAGKDDSTYDPLKDFQYAKAHNTGLVLWDTIHPNETAEGETKLGNWRWVLDSCRKFNLSFGYNPSMGDSESWVFNRYREQTTMGMPGYVGGWYGVQNYGEGQVSWYADKANEVQLSALQKTMRKFNDVDNIVNWLEPHAEIGHGAPDIMGEYGPVADASYRRYLKETYGSDVAAVSKRWYDASSTLGSWNDVHVPQIASFLGYGPDAIDLTGLWRVNYELPMDASSGLRSVDDSSWITLNAPGDDIEKVIDRKPAILRRHFQVDAKWKSSHDHIWLYCWDLDDSRPQDASNNRKAFPGDLISVNGTKITESAATLVEMHIGIVDVSNLIQAGDNLITLGLSSGSINYKVYLSGQPPKMYPALGPKLNAQWVDFCDWVDWGRAVQVRRGAQMIRQLDPNRPITLMEPYDYIDGIKSIAEDYGGIFHDTGAMPGIFDCEFLPMLMRSSNLPFDCEPGGPCKTLEQFKFFMGNWSTEAIQGIDYFMHIGDIEWSPEISSYFDQTLPLWQMIGKSHVPKSEVAIFHGDRALRLTNFPFNQQQDPNVYFPGGFWQLRLQEALFTDFQVETIVEGDFDRGLTKPYKIIIDSNTSIMDQKCISKIEKWVRAGGIFVTYGETGRHTSTEMDTWPISKLTGYKVTAIEPLDQDGKVKAWKRLTLAPNQPVFKPGDWHEGNGTGLHLQKVDPACQDLMIWDDGTVAAGLRHLGKGMVIDLGVRYSQSAGAGDVTRVRPLLQGILDWAGIQRIPGGMDQDFVEFGNVLRRYYVSNNGLFDVWTLWDTKGDPLTETLKFGSLKPAYALDVQSGQRLPIQTDAKGVSTLPNLSFDARGTKVILTPRGKLADAPSEWFELQRGWWAGTANPGPLIPQEKSKLAFDLSEDWAMQQIADPTSDASSLAAPNVDEAAWKRVPLGIISLPDYPDLQHAMLRKKFTVPANWSGGHVSLWVQSWLQTFYGKGQVYLDGKAVGKPTPYDVMIPDTDGVLKPGSDHLIAIEVWADGKKPVGVPGAAWLSFRPTPIKHQDLAGNWTLSTDGLSPGATTPLPGAFNGKVATLNVDLDPAQSARNVVIHASGSGNNLTGVIINGHYVERFHHRLANEINLNVTPWVKFGQPNQVRLVTTGPFTLSEVAVDYYDKNAYP